MWNTRELFIVPGVPATRTTLPCGMPPPRELSRPSTRVRKSGRSFFIKARTRVGRYKMPHRAVIQRDSHTETIVFPCRPYRGSQVGHVTSKREDAALRVLEWELDGHGNDVLQAMLAHPDLNLAEAVELIERENPEWGGGAVSRGARGLRPPTALPALRRRIRVLALQAAFWRELAGPPKAMNALGLMVIMTARSIVAQSGANGGR